MILTPLVAAGAMNDGLDLMEPEEEPKITLKIFFGHIKLDTRVRWVGNRGIGESRKLEYDGDGLLVKDSGWVPTGCNIVWPELDEQESKALREGMAILREGFFRNVRRAREVALKFRRLTS
jgi:hypothetical protein